MDVFAFIVDLRQKGFHLKVIGNRLSVSSSKEMSLTDQQKQSIKAHQKHIIDFLSAEESVRTSVSKIQTSSILPLSAAQQRLWFMDKLYNEGAYAYNMPVAFSIKGKLERELLEQAINLLVKKHTILRTVFKQDADGQVYQEILPFEEKTKIIIRVKKIDVTAIEECLRSAALERFDLSSEPLIRVYLFDIHHEFEEILFINQHHIISDAWSLNLFFKEVSNLYNRLISEKEIKSLLRDTQYADYVIEEKENLQQANGVNQIEYWRANLKDYNDLNLFFIENRIKFPTNNGSNITFHVEENIVNRLKEYASSSHSTIHMILLSVFYGLLYRYSGQHDIVIGVPYINRDSFKAEDMLGFFANMLPIRINIKNPTVEKLLEYVKNKSIDAYHHNISFEYLVEHLEIRRDNTTPIFQVAFAYYPESEDLDLNGVRIEKINFDRGSAKYHLNLTFEMKQGKLIGELEFNTALLNASLAGNIVQAYKLILQDLLWNPQKNLSQLKILSNSAYEEIIYKINSSKKLCPQDKTMQQCFEEQVEKTPNHIAVVFGQQKLTYRELNECSNQLANLIRDKYKAIYHKNIQQNVSIGLYLDRSLETVISILSVLKAGAAYVPFDTSTAHERLKFQILDSHCSLIVTQSHKHTDLLKVVREKSLLLTIDELQEELPKYSKNNLSRLNTPIDPIYIIYTSGSTGKPKGVVQLHHNIRRLFWVCEKYFYFTDQDVWTLFHSYSFDFSVWEMWGALLYGGKLIIPNFLETRDLYLFHKLLVSHKVTVLNQTPTAFYELAKIDRAENVRLETLRYIIFGGEALKTHLLKNWVNKYGLDQPELINMYGITEISVHATYKRILTDELNQSISNVGKPLADLTAYVLDHHLCPLPVGMPGELYIGGQGLAKYYLNLPELTAEKFINNPFASQDDKKNNFNLQLYKTGDIVRWLENGDLEYINRIDHQIQLRGFRIELEEIENKLLSHENISNAVVLCKEQLCNDDSVYKYLCAYYTVKEKRGFIQKAESRLLKEYLMAHLPDYMIPSYFVCLETFPLTSNGKLDKNALPEPSFLELENINRYLPPRNDLEKKLCNIWQELLRVKNVSINTHFFEIGGNSILLLQMVTKIKKDLNLDVSLIDLFTYPNIKLLVNYLVNSKTVKNAVGDSNLMIPPLTEKVGTQNPDQLDNTLDTTLCAQVDTELSINGNLSVPPQSKQQQLTSKEDIAVIGYSGAFSGCQSIQELWNKIFNGIDCITRLSIEEAIKIGAKEELLRQKEYIRATGLVANINEFDAAFFGIAPSEARFMDPQTRLFIEHTWKALEIAGYISKREKISIGVFAGAGKPTYLYENLKKSSIINEGNYDWEMDTLADPRRISTLTSFYLNLTGPSIFIDTACSTSMVAIIEAAMYLQSGLCEIAIAGGCSLYFPQNFGYMYKNSMVGSSEGICAPFSEEASGIVPGSGVGVVILKRLADAIKDKDIISAVIKGYGINNDGNRKVGYVAPSVTGQKDCILSALYSANIPKQSISYIECHGTGTKLGDSIEISTLKEIFDGNHSNSTLSQPMQKLPETIEFEKYFNTQKIFLGSIKANIGHTDTAAGIASFIKVCKMFEYKKIPPQLHCSTPNDQINAAKIFEISKEAQDWRVGAYPRRAGITSLGIGGTNTHIILEEANSYSPMIDIGPGPSHYLFSISAKSSYSLIQAKQALLEYLKKSDVIDLLNLTYTLHTAREAFSNRYTFVAKDYHAAIHVLEENLSKNVSGSNEIDVVEVDKNLTTIFLYSLSGLHNIHLTNELYEIFPVYREKIEQCNSLLKSHWDKNFNSLVNQTNDQDLIAFIQGYSLLQLLMSLGIKPDHIVGIETGQELAACISEDLSLEDALSAMMQRCEMIKDISISEATAYQEDSSHAFEERLQSLFLLDNAIFIDIGLGEDLINRIKQLSINSLELISVVFPRTPLGPGMTLRGSKPIALQNNLVSIVKPQTEFNSYKWLIKALGQLWLQGISIHWEKFYERYDCRRIELPTYAFEKKSFWVEPILSSELKTAEQFQEKNKNMLDLAFFWEKVFKLKNIDIHTNFFDLGGTSVLGIRLTQLISDHFNVEMSVNLLFEHPTIFSLTQALSNLSKKRSLNLLHQNSVENELKKIWTEVFMIEEIDTNANFFDLGGTSVLAIRLIQLMSDHFNAEISINTLFENPTIAALNSILSKDLIKKAEPLFKPIVPDQSNAYQPFPLTDIQRAYLLGRQNLYALGNVATHAYIERDFYELDIDKVEDAFNQLIIRHPMLRVIFDVNAASQRILEKVPYYKIQVQYIDAVEQDVQERKLNDWRQKMSHQVLDITTWPIFDIRCSVLSDKIKLHLSFEVLVLDGQSLNTLMSEWTALYNNQPLAELDCSFRDCVLNYQNLRQSNRYMRDKEYWLRRIENFPPRPNLPLKVQPEYINFPSFKRCVRYIDVEIWNRFKAQCNRFNPRITPTAALALCYGIVLARWSKNNHFAINLTFFNRLPLHSHIDHIVGDFTSLELLEIDLHALKACNFMQKAAQLQSLLYADLDHVLFSGIEVQREINRRSNNYKGVSYPIVFTSLLSLNMRGGAFLSDSLIEDDSNDITQTSQVWLDNKAYELKQGFIAEWDYVEELFPEGMIESMHQGYCYLIEHFATADWIQGSLPCLLDDDTMKLIQSVNAVTKKFPDYLLHESFFINAITTPDKIAVISSTGSLTYGELAARSSRIAHYLKEQRVMPNRLVAVVLQKGWEQLVACYGILQAGAAYLPIDPDWPHNRIKEVLSQGQVQIILTHSDLVKILQERMTPDCPYHYLCLDDEPFWRCYSSEPLPRQQKLDDIAYVIFTSGSTGKPKGAMITHRNVTNTICDINERFKVKATDVVLALSNLSFDLSVYDTFGVLSSGGTIVMPAPNQIKDPSAWVPLILNHQVTLWNTVPMFMRMLIEYTKTLTTNDLRKIKSSLRIVMMSGDFIPLELPEKIQSIFENVEVHSVGGPTECSIWSITYPIEKIDPSWTSIPYGKAMANQKIYVLNDQLEECPVFVEGNIYIGGIGVGKGYWRDDQLTAEKFIIHPQTGERIFKTGDLGKLRGDGNIEILGREDNQVKISGHRVELGEIKKVIKEIEGVDEVIITVSGEKLSDKKLIAYVLWKKKNREIPEVELLKFKQSSFNLRKNNLFNETIQLRFPIVNQARIDHYFKRKSYRHFLKERIKDTAIKQIFKLHRVNMLDNDQYQLSNLSSLDKLSILLQENYAYQDEKLILPKYRYPSAGSLYPVQIYITLNLQKDSKMNGSYYYNPHEHQLYKVSEICNFSNHEVTINFVSNLNAIKPLYGEWAEPFCELECGYISELFEIACNRLRVTLIRTELKVDLVSKLQCIENSHYHYSLGINFSDAILPDSSLALEVSKDLSIYVYIKPHRVTHFKEGLYQLENKELKYFNDWQPKDEYLSQIGMLGSTMKSATCIIFFVGEKKADNNYLIGKISQNLINEAINHNIGSCSIGYFGTNLGGFLGQLEDKILHSIVMGPVSEEQMQSLQYSEPDKKLWDVKKFINHKINQFLPSYMLPESYLEIDVIPLSANGKVDIKALPVHRLNVSENKQYTSPKSETEKSISKLWCELLNLEKVSVNDNFFELGGNSIKVITLRNKIHDSFGFNMDIIDLFNHPTIKLLAEKLAAATSITSEEDDAYAENYPANMNKRKRMRDRFKKEHEEA